MVHRDPPALLVAPLEQRRLDHPAERPRVRRGSGRAGRPGRAGGRRGPRSARSARSATMQTRSPSAAPGAARAMPAISSGDRNFSTGDRTAPSASTASHTSPAAPRPLASSISLSSSLRENDPRAGRRQGLDRAAVGEHRRERVEPRPREHRSRGRPAPCRSGGRACPNRTAPSSRRRSCAGTASGTSTPRDLAHDARVQRLDQRDRGPPRSTNDISTSSWVNSKPRSARGASSRRHRTIW